MIPIREFLNKIKWDKREKPESYTLVYLDFGKPVEVPYLSIKELDENFMVVLRNGKEAEIPLHRIRKVKKEGAVVWER